MRDVERKLSGYAHDTVGAQVTDHLCVLRLFVLLLCEIKISLNFVNVNRLCGPNMNLVDFKRRRYMLQRDSSGFALNGPGNQEVDHCCGNRCLRGEEGDTTHC